jgi:hypothetical protein
MASFSIPSILPIPPIAACSHLADTLLRIAGTIGEVDFIPMRRDREWAGFRFRQVCEGARIPPPETRVERSRALITSSDREPRASMSGTSDFVLGGAKKPRRHTGSAGGPVDVDLLHFIALHDDESHGLAAGLRDPGAIDPVLRPGHELFLLTMADELGRHVAGVTVPPADVPDPGNYADIV